MKRKLWMASPGQIFFAVEVEFEYDPSKVDSHVHYQRCQQLCEDAFNSTFAYEEET